MSFRSYFCSYKFRRSPHALTTPSFWGPVEIIPAAACSLEATCYAFQGKTVVDDTLLKRHGFTNALIGVQRASLTYELHETLRSIPLLPPGISHALLLVSYLVLAVVCPHISTECEDGNHIKGLCSLFGSHGPVW